MKTNKVVGCCGRKRDALRTGGDSTPHLQPLPLHRGGQIPVTFRYVGETALTIHGPISGRTYRFETPGAEMEVDGRDAYGFDTVPVLARVRC
jgi:hypothetical protein